MITTECPLIGGYKFAANLGNDLSRWWGWDTRKFAYTTGGTGKYARRRLKGARDHLLTLFGFTDGLGSGNSKNATAPRAL
jgi:hypothetical protein